MADNPISFIDPDGRKIKYSGSLSFKIKAFTIHLFGRILSKEFRKQYRSLRNDKTHTFIFDDIKNHKYYGHQYLDDAVHSPRFLSNSVEHNNNLLIPTPEEILSDDWVDPHIYHDRDGTGDGGTIYLNLTKNYKQYIKKNGLGNLIVIIGHEMSHANDARKGIRNTTINTKYNSPISEIKAIRVGNRIRGNLNRLKLKKNRFKLRSVRDYDLQPDDWPAYLKSKVRN